MKYIKGLWDKIVNKHDEVIQLTRLDLTFIYASFAILWFELAFRA